MKWTTLAAALVLYVAEASANQGASFMPTAATDIAGQVDSLYSFLVWVSGIACAILIGGMIYFALKYKRKTNADKTAYITHNTFLEFLWSFIPLVIFMAVFGWGWYIYHQMLQVPANALEVHVLGKQWAWEFHYKSGKVATNEFVVPVNTPVKLILGSKDVLHSFYIPSMRIKQDAVPGRYTYLWFDSEKLGDFHIFCTEFCGDAHSNMIGRMKVVSQDEYEKWLQVNEENMTLTERGQKYFNDFTCVACHSIDGSKKVGPSLKGIFGVEQVLADGSKVNADENFLRESILNPNATVIQGYTAGVMPAFQGQIDDTKLNALIEFIKSLK
jgi:cytochrome c oxidase subunit 2